jgi:tripartite-type tricarboxylate transporter receptor subunit TctC
MLALVASTAPASVNAQSYPSRVVRLVVPFPPGGPLDISGRLLAQKLSEAWGQSVVVENRPGAGGNIGADLVAKSAPDGYTIVMGALSTHAVNPSLYPKMPYDAVKDFAPITLLATTPNVLVVNPSLPVNSVKDLIAYAKANPGKLSFGSGSNGSAGHLAGELFKVDTGYRHRPHSLQRRGAGHAGVARRRCAVHVRQSRQCNAANQGRQTEGSGGDDGRSLQTRARLADDG